MNEEIAERLKEKRKAKTRGYRKVDKPWVFEIRERKNITRGTRDEWCERNSERFGCRRRVELGWL